MAVVKRKYGARSDLDLDAAHLKELAGEFLEIVKRHSGKPFPQDPYEQLEIAVGAVFRSWMGKRAVDYRRQFKITPEMANGTAVNICTMVFGNMGNDSGTGVGFTRNPGTGENVIYGEYLVNAQGEDVVAGIRTPKPIAELEAGNAGDLPPAAGTAQPAGVALPRGAGLRVHDREGQALLPADPQRQDERAGDGAHLGRDVPRGADLQGAGPAARRARDAGAAAGAAALAEFPRQVAGAGAACLARCGFRQDRVRRRLGRGAGPGRRKSDPGARGDQAGGHPRLLPGAGNSHQPRRQDLARRGGRARHGQALRLGLRADRDQRQGAQRDDRRDDAARRRRDHHRRRHRPRLRRRSSHGGSQVLGRDGHAARMGGRGGETEGDGQRRHAGGCPARAEIRRHGHRAGAHRAHVQQHRPPAHRAGDDPGRDPGGAPGRARSPAADPASRLQGHLQGDEGAARHGAPARPADARIPADRGATRTRDRAPAPDERQHQGAEGAAGYAQVAQPEALPAIRRRPDQARGRAARLRGHRTWKTT